MNPGGPEPSGPKGNHPFLAAPLVGAIIGLTSAPNWYAYLRISELKKKKLFYHISSSFFEREGGGGDPPQCLTFIFLVLGGQGGPLLSF